MSTLRLSLFGKLSVQYGAVETSLIESRKAQELLGYLLLFRMRPHHRERIAPLFWLDVPNAIAKRYLSKALWQLQTALQTLCGTQSTDLLQVDSDWIELSLQGDCWLDVAVFEDAFLNTQRTSGRQLNEGQIQVLEQAVALYRSDLLEGWYQDWCVLERQRFQHLLLAMLDKMMDYYDADRQYEHALYCGQLVLGYDRARECTHQQLMQLRYLTGDRTGALRQYEQCVAALWEELEVAPSAHTEALHTIIRAGGMLVTEAAGKPATALENDTAVSLKNSMSRVQALNASLLTVHAQLRHELEAIESILRIVPEGE